MLVFQFLIFKLAVYIIQFIFAWVIVSFYSEITLQLLRQDFTNIKEWCPRMQERETP